MTSQNISFDSDVTGGNCLLVYITHSTAPGNSISISGVSDNRGNTWSQIKLINDTSLTQTSAVYGTFNCAAGSTTITVQFTGGSATYVGMIAAEYTNASAVDVSTGFFNAPTQTNGTTTVTNGMNTGAMTTTAAGETIVAFFTDDNNPDEIVAGTTYAFLRRESSMVYGSTVLAPGNNYPSIMMEDYIQPSAGSITPTASSTDGIGTYYTGIAVALKTGTTNTPTFTNGLVSTYAGDYSNTTTPKTLSVTTLPGDYVVVYGGGNGGRASTPFTTLGTPSGNSITFTLQASVNTSGYATAYIWSGQDNIGGTNWTLSCTGSGGGHWGFSCLVFRNIAGIGASAASHATAGTGVFPNVTLPTTGGNSSIVVFESDYDTMQSNIDGYIHHWLAINGTAPTFGNNREIDLGVNRYISTQFSMNGAIYDNVSPGSINAMPAMTFPDGQQYSMVALEILQPVTTAAMPWLLDPSSLWEMSEYFDTYATSTTVSTGSNPTNFSSVQSGTSGTGVIDSAQAESGLNALKVTIANSANNQFYVRYNFNTSTAKTYVRAAFYLTAYPSNRLLVYGIVTPSTNGTNTDEANVAILPSGGLQLISEGASTSISFTGANSTPLNQWFTLEYYIDYAGSQQTVRIYNSAGTLTGTVYTTSSGYSGQMPSAIKIGGLGDPGTTTPIVNLTYWIDSVAVRKDDWIGPA